MDSLPLNLNALNAYSTPPTNYIGTALFLSYIAAALYLTTSISLALYTQYTTTLAAPSKDAAVTATRAARARHVNIYAFLASVSFACISYHMLSFLLASFAAWDGSAGFALGSVTGAKLRSWMLQTELFESFAQELVRDGASAIWTQASLLAMWFWGVWAAQKARQRDIPLQTIIPFILLSQILPMSLTVSLFLIHLHLTSPDIDPPTTAAPPPTPPKPTAQASLLLPTILLNTSLLALPALRHHPNFPALVLFTRGLLVLPYTPLLRLRDKDVVKCITVSGGFVIAHWAMLRGQVRVQDVVRALWGNEAGREAVRALGWDAGIGGIVYMVLGWGGGV